MIISTITQIGLHLYADPEQIPFQYSSNIQMQFIKDENYNDYTVVGYYIPPGQHEAKLLSINDDGTFTLGPDCFKNRGMLSFSFNLINSQEEVHLGSIDFEVRYSFGDGDTILPEPEEVWISLVTQVAEDAIKEDVELVKQKAKEASQSASLANDKASEAEEYANNANQSAGSASLSASSALTAKNDAIAASNSAIQAKQDAEQSANNAKNSANTALENANKSTEAIETVTQIKTEIENKANDFDTNYQEKLKSFNDNATSKQNAFDNSVQTANTNLDNKVNQANSDLDDKVQKANTIIDEKVKTATEQAQKATDEANRAEQATDGKLDKNLGVENAGKSLVVGENGEVVCGESGINEDEVNKIIDKAIDEKLYTQEEVDYMLADKMDKPYVPIEITDSATITDALEGNFKIDKIKGNTYQNVETDIVPTPERPVPINSRKVKANGEYVELRSLKETINKFDLGLLSRTELMETSGSYRKINIPLKLKPNTRYKIYYEKSMIPALTWMALNIVNNTEEIIVAILNVKNTENSEVEKQAINLAFTSPNDREIYFSYYVQMYNIEGNLIPQTTETFKEKWFTKILKNIMVTEESLNQNTYVPPTIRDYKIVDHTTQTSKIVRNTFELLLTGAENWQLRNSFGDLSQYFYLSTQYVSDASNDTKNTHFKIGDPYSLNEDCLGFFVRDVRIRYDKYNENIEGLKQWLSENNVRVFGKLQTPTEEEIAYSADDVSEVGYSWQDTTSPSPTIKSEVTKIDKIDCTVCGKNLFDIKSYEFTTNLQSGKVSANKIVKVNDTTLRVQNPNVASYAVGDKFVVKANKPLIISFDILEITGTELINVVFYKETGSLLKSFEYRTIKVGTRFVIDTPITTRNNYVYIGFQSVGAGSIVTISNILLEHASIATTYEPPTEQHVNITPPQPLYENDIANVESENYEYEMQKYVVTGNEMFLNDYQNQAGYYGRYFNLKNGNGVLTEKIWCNYLSYIRSSWASASEGCCQNSRTQIHLKFSNDRLGITDNTPVEEKRLAFANYLKQLYASEEPLYVVGKVAKTTQPIPEDDLAKLKSLKTNAGVNNIFVGGEIKPSIEARYPQDVVSAVNRLQNKLLTLQEEVVKNV